MGYVVFGVGSGWDVSGWRVDLFLGGEELRERMILDSKSY